MPGVLQGREMNGYTYNPQGNYQNPNFDHDRSRDYSDRGLSVDAGMESRYGPNAAVFEVDHLATFTAGSKQAVLNPEEGLSKLRLMDSTTGIWTLRCTLVLVGRTAIIVDKTTGDEMEKFALDLLHNPAAVQTGDKRDMYNNVLLFTVLEDNRKRNAPSEMHIFQPVYAQARDIVDEIKRFKEGRPKRNIAAPSPPHFQNIGNRGPSQSQIPPTQLVQRDYVTDGESVVSERTEMDVYVLNRCFDDIERFVGKLQVSAEAYRELTRRQETRRQKKNAATGEGMLAVRSKLPPIEEFVDTFKKFKLSFNLLAQLQGHIHDPNAPELIHFLFTPLLLVVDACRDPNTGLPDLAQRVVSPLLSRGAIELLRHCLNSRESDLWSSLGVAWCTPRDQWTGIIPPFEPRFDNMPPGCEAVWEDENSLAQDGPPSESEHRVTPRRQESDRDPDRVSREYAPREPASQAYYYRSEQNQQPELDWEDRQLHFAREVRSRGGKLYQCIKQKEGRNSKELTVQQGELLEVLDDTRNWWKLRNSLGMEGHSPYTVLQPYGDTAGGYEDERGFSQRPSALNTGYQQSGGPPAPPSQPPPPPQPMPTEPVFGRRGKKGEFRYF